MDDVFSLRKSNFAYLDQHLVKLRLCLDFGNTFQMPLHYIRFTNTNNKNNCQSFILNGLKVSSSLPVANEGIQEWWRQSLQTVPKFRRRAAAALLINTCWNIWNERNRRIFQNRFATPQGVFCLIKEEIGLRQKACGVPVIQ